LTFELSTLEIYNALQHVISELKLLFNVEKMLSDSIPAGLILMHSFHNHLFKN